MSTEGETAVSTAVLDGVSEGVVVVDDGRRCTYANDRAVTVLECDDDPQGDRIDDAVPGVDSEALVDRVETAIAGGDPEPLAGHTGDGRVTVGVSPTPDGASVHLRVQSSADRAAERTTRWLETLLENTDEVVYVKDLDGVYRLVSEAAAEMFGMERSAVVGRHDEDLFGPDDAADIAATDRRVCETGEPEVHETERHIDGERHVFIGETFPVRGDDGDVVGVMGISRDITEREEREERLQRQQYLFERAQEVGEFGVWEYDPESETVAWSEGVRAIHGVDEAFNPTLESAVEFYHPEDRADVRTAVDRAVDDQEPFDRRVRITDADGERRHVRCVGEPVVEGGETRLVHGVFRDVTGRVEHERALTELHEVGLDLGQADSVAAVAQRTVDAAREVLDLDLSVVSEEDDGVLRAVATSDELPADATEAIPVDEGLAGLSYRTGESRVVEDTDEHDVAYDSRYRSAISVPIGDYGNFQAVAERPGAFDETDLERAELLVDRARSALDRVERERALRRENDRLEEFASVVSHDLRNPLEIALGRTALLQQELDSEHLEEIDDALNRMTAIVEDTLTLARQGRTVGETERVPLTTLLGRCWDTVDAADATLDVEDDLAVRADRDRLRHVFENLFRNAVDHAGPDVAVRVGRLDGGFFVADDGPGIPEAERERVFEPGHTGADGGTGFGLTIVKRIAGAHGWTVRVVESDEGGARFEFTGVDVVD